MIPPYYQDSQALILNGDCLRLLPELEDASIDTILCDPPYGIDFQSGHKPKHLRHQKIANDKQPFVWWLGHARRLLKPAGCLICFCRWDVQEAFRLAISWTGLEVQSQVIWDRGVHGSGDLKAQFGPQHDVIWFATQPGFQFIGGRPVSVIRTPRIAGSDLLHPNEKPVWLLEYLLRHTTPPGGVVLDPCMGSGATLRGAKNVGLSAIGMELDLDHCRTGRDKLLQEVLIPG